MRDAVKDEAELIAISYTLTVDLTYRSDQEMEKANWITFPAGCSVPADFGPPPAGCSAQATT